MPVLVDRLEEMDVNALIWFGPVSRSDALGVPGRIDPSRPQFGSRWISYFDDTADLSDLNAASLLELRERLRPVVAALAAKGAFRMILASNSKYNIPLLAVWRAMTAGDAAYPSNPVVVRDLQSAARVLGLTEAEAARVRGWVEARIASPAAL